ncbi:MAG: hypothetical protein ACFFCV_07150 [Promethearchaeota archaeon]
MGITKPCKFCTGHAKAYHSEHCYFNGKDYKGNDACAIQVMETWKCQECDKINEAKVDFIHFKKKLSQVTEDEFFKVKWNLGYVY